MLTTNQPDLELGKLKFGVPHNFTYKLTNIGTEPVKVTKVALGCSSCTQASINKADVAPGETATVSATFTPGSTGINVKSIDIIYTEKGIPLTVKLKFKASVSA